MRGKIDVAMELQKLPAEAGSDALGEPAQLKRARSADLAWIRPLSLLLILALAAGCASTQSPSCSGRPFAFPQDTFAFANELVWDYTIDPETGRTRHLNRQPRPSYHHRCFVLARSCRQFFQCARFDPSQPVASADVYRDLVRRVVSMNPARPVAETGRVVIPGYANLNEFSLEHETLLKQSCGSTSQSYFQRGHWRMILPFSRKHQQNTACRLVRALQNNQAPVVHLVDFPSLAINHAVVLFAYSQTPTGIDFAAYDPNAPSQPTTLTYHPTERCFFFPRNPYYRGGPLDVYEVYRSWLY